MKNYRILIHCVVEIPLIEFTVSSMNETISMTIITKIKIENPRIK